MESEEQAQRCVEALHRSGVGLGHETSDQDPNGAVFMCLFAPLTAHDLQNGKAGGAPLTVGGSAARLWRALYELVLAVGAGSSTSTATVHPERRAAAIGCAWTAALAVEESQGGAGAAGTGASGMPALCAVLERAIEACQHQLGAWGMGSRASASRVIARDTAAAAVAAAVAAADAAAAGFTAVSACSSDATGGNAAFVALGWLMAVADGLYFPAHDRPLRIDVQEASIDMDHRQGDVEAAAAAAAAAEYAAHTATIAAMERSSPATTVVSDTGMSNDAGPVIGTDAADDAQAAQCRARALTHALMRSHGGLMLRLRALVSRTTAARRLCRRNARRAKRHAEGAGSQRQRQRQRQCHRDGFSRRDFTSGSGDDVELHEAKLEALHWAWVGCMDIEEALNEGDEDRGGDDTDDDNRGDKRALAQALAQVFEQRAELFGWLQRRWASCRQALRAPASVLRPHDERSLEVMASQIDAELVDLQHAVTAAREENVQHTGAGEGEGRCRTAVAFADTSAARQALEQQRQKLRLALSQCLASGLPFHVVRRLDVAVTGT